MAKNVFRAFEVTPSSTKVHIPPPGHVVEQPIDLDEVEEYTGPTADELRREAEEFKERWEQEREQMIEDARKQAQEIIQEAENTAFEEVKRKTEQANNAKQEADEQAGRIVAEAEERAKEIVAEAEKNAEMVELEARQRGLEAGRQEGYQDGAAEAERLVGRLHTIIDAAIQRRNDIIEESEGQIVQLVLQIAKKVIKVISENQKNIVVNNVVQSLRKMKKRSDVTIRVNLADLKLTTQHTQQITEKIETVQNVKILEDSTVDPGGCIIETDFGQIDARIATQLQEIEDQILQLVPIKARSSIGGA
ncbi:flagellar assembly protein FliH [Spirochaeta africana]|uniref:Flagellar assembly protein FliH n=1 Tax=Spirochaeta africana (strain ATCC 700263 / DSM 8902 / Z-7692) TaxID=889378 RepID=H9UKV8_SPIAZ|nr:flagellar assembly protein FliH [Spirochaeta africana]AFG38151.1 flagellar biosynthesis/type III secretory pathway protein [Spirochaeta africana DSM 8902]